MTQEEIIKALEDLHEPATEAGLVLDLRYGFADIDKNSQLVKTVSLTSMMAAEKTMEINQKSADELNRCIQQNDRFEGLLTRLEAWLNRMDKK